MLWLTRQLGKQKVAGTRIFFYFFENFSKFFGIFKGENTLFSKSAQTSTNVPGRPEGSYLKFYKCLNYIFNNNTFSPI
jgi:hypothetical protein